MNRVLNILKVIFVSFESLGFFLPLLLRLLILGDFFENVSNLFFSTKDIEHIVFQFILPVTLATISYNHIKDILNPDMNLKKFYSWHDYKKLKDTLMVGFGWNALCLLLLTSFLIELFNLDKDLKGALFVSAIISSALSTLSIVIAKQKIKEIIELGKSE